VKNITEAIRNTTRVYTSIRAAFFLFLLMSEESVKSRMFLWASMRDTIHQVRRGGITEPDGK